MASARYADPLQAYPKPVIGLLALDKMDKVLHSCEDFISLLRTGFELRQIDASQLASHAFRGDDRQIAILCADHSLMEETHHHLIPQASDYTCEGGILVFMVRCPTSSPTTPRRKNSARDFFVLISLP